MRKCQKCGEPIEEGTKYCPSCGALIGYVSNNYTKPQNMDHVDEDGTQTKTVFVEKPNDTNPQSDNWNPYAQNWGPKEEPAPLTEPEPVNKVSGRLQKFLYGIGGITIVLGLIIIGRQFAGGGTTAYTVPGSSSGNVKADPGTTDTPGTGAGTSFDAFAEISLVFSGDTTQGTAEVIDYSDGSRNLTYDVSPSESLSNGDTVTVTVHPTGAESFTEEYEKEYGAIPKTISKTYVVEGLSNFYYRGWERSSPLEVAIWDTTLVDGFQEIADEFTERTGIPVEVRGVNFNDFWEEVDDRSLADVFWMSGYESEKAMYQEDLLDLTSYISDQGIDLSNFDEEYTDMYTRDDKVYAIPMGLDTIALWYNKTMFDEAGLSYPDETWTWDDVYSAAQVLNDSANGRYGYAINYGNDQDGYYNMIYAHGGYVVSEDGTRSGYDDPRTIETFEFIDDLRQYGAPRSVLKQTSIENLMTAGQIAMCTRGSWALPVFNNSGYMRDNCDVAIIPYDAETGDRVSILSCLGWSASSKTEYPDESALLIEWFCSREMQEKEGQLGIYIPAYKGLESSFTQYTDYFNVEAYLDVLQPTSGGIENTLVMMPHSYDTESWRPDIKVNFRRAWDGEITMESACRENARIMNSKLSQY